MKVNDNVFIDSLKTTFKCIEISDSCYVLKNLDNPNVQKFLTIDFQSFEKLATKIGLH